MRARCEGSRRGHVRRELPRRCRAPAPQPGSRTPLPGRGRRQVTAHGFEYRSGFAAAERSNAVCEELLSIENSANVWPIWLPSANDRASPGVPPSDARALRRPVKDRQRAMSETRCRTRKKCLRWDGCRGRSEAIERCERVCGTRTFTVDSKDSGVGVALARVLICDQQVPTSCRRAAPRENRGT